jgi:hypothetical protein
VTRYEEKLSRIRSGDYRKGDFLIADAKDGDMGPALASSGPVCDETGAVTRFRTRSEFVQAITEIVKQDIVDIMLTSASNLELLMDKGAFNGSKVKPAIRANDTTDIWVGRGATYATIPSRPFRTASIVSDRRQTDLGLYSITFNNDIDADCASLAAFADFRKEAEHEAFDYFLEVFNPNAPAGLSPQDIPQFVNDSIVRCLAGLTRAERPKFLKIAFNGPKALEELASWDPSLVVGVLGGGAGTARDTFELIHQAEKYGARVALFGRKINLAEDALSIVRLMRAVADGETSPEQAVRAYHGELDKKAIQPVRTLEDDLVITEAVLKPGSN